MVGRRPRRAAQGRPHLVSHGDERREQLNPGRAYQWSPGRKKAISGTRQFGEVRSRNLTASAMSSGRIIASAATCSLTNSVIGVSTNAGANAVTWTPWPAISFWVACENPITAALVAE